jgi:hypothetical protein
MLNQHLHTYAHIQYTDTHTHLTHTHTHTHTHSIHTHITQSNTMSIVKYFQSFLSHSFNIAQATLRKHNRARKIANVNVTLTTKKQSLTTVTAGQPEHGLHRDLQRRVHPQDFCPPAILFQGTLERL